MSETVAPAADTASAALTLTFGDGCEPPLGNKTRMTLSQNAIRRMNRMTPALQVPAAVIAALGRRLAAGLEMPVGQDARFLRLFEANARRIFRKFESIAI